MPTPTTEKFRLAPRLRDARLREGAKTTQTELVRRLQAAGLPHFLPTHASQLELGYRDATWDEVVALAAALHVDPHWLAGRPAPPPPAPPPPPPAPAPVLRLPPVDLPTPNGHGARVLLAKGLADAEGHLADRSLSPAEWRAWRDYSQRVRAALLQIRD